MVLRGCLALLAALISGCVGPLGEGSLATRVAADPALAIRISDGTPKDGGGTARPKAPSEISPSSAESTTVVPSILGLPPLPVEKPPTLPTAPVVEPEPTPTSPPVEPETLAEARPEPPVVEALPAAPIVDSQTTVPSVAAPVPAPPADVEIPAPPPPAPANPPEVAAKVEVAKPTGRPVASVGEEMITLPELTEAVKIRLAQLGPDQSPTRRQVIAMARSILKSMIVRSLVFQEANEKLGGPDGLSEAEARILKDWADREMPEVLRREGVATEAELRSKLARKQATPESLRDEYVVRSMATELIRRDGSIEGFDGYLDGLRKRRPIASIMSPAELVAAGRRAASESELTP
ncbi:hypothetical protein P12x_000478 [Tundrisphaera lichenicola]|uniref:hypothetical protein n=1 Tax=Tundrisphaera lichenicola TaxID=2029860 RepID=UPI003EBFF010